jgi:hypothetical protein
VLHDALLYRANKLCISTSSIRILFLQEAHGGGLIGYFGVKKIENVLTALFFWSKMRRAWSATCHGALLAIKLSLDLIHMVFICLFLFLVCLGMIFLWTRLRIAWNKVGEG